MPLDPALAAAGILVAGLGVFHSVMGERYVVRRLLRRDNLPKLFGDDSFTKLTIRYAWHLLTIVVFAMAAILFWAAARPTIGGRAWPAGIVACALGAAAVWGIVSTRGRHLSWIVLAGAAILSFVGAGLHQSLAP